MLYRGNAYLQNMPLTANQFTSTGRLSPLSGGTYWACWNSHRPGSDSLEYLDWLELMVDQVK
jgi:hypothetical protein